MPSILPLHSQYQNMSSPQSLTHEVKAKQMAPSPLFYCLTYALFQSLTHEIKTQRKAIKGKVCRSG